MTWSLSPTRKFLRAYKRLNNATKLVVDSEVIKIADNPNIGEKKSGNLKSIYVHKFHFQTTLYLIAYSKNEEIRIIDLEAVGPHENFYRDLTR